MKKQVLVTAGSIQKSKAMILFCGFALSLSAFSQTDSSLPKTFIFSKYQLPAQGESTVTSFFNAPQKSSPYKIHYKIKTLTFPADPDPKPKRFNLIDALITGYLEDKYKDKNDDRFLIPVKKNTPNP
jgi:hypothetical protein